MPHPFQSLRKISKVVFAVNKLFGYFLNKISTSDNIDACGNISYRMDNIQSNHCHQHTNDQKQSKTRSDQCRHPCCHIFSQFILSCCNFVINVIRIISGTDNPVKRLKILTVRSLRRRFCLSLLRIHVINISSAFFYSYPDNLFYHLISVTVRGFHSIGSFRISSKKYHIGSVRCINPEISGISITHLTDFLCCNRFSLINRFKNTRFILIINLRQKRYYNTNLILDCRIIILTNRYLQLIQRLLLYLL